MSIAKSFTAHLVGLSVEIITVEVDISNGLNHVNIVGLGDRAVEEAKDRVSAAIKNSGYVSPKQKNQKVVISLAPADVRKEGAAFDLSIALSYLAASGEIEASRQFLILGELSLEGKIRKVPGVLPILCQAARAGWKKAIIPSENALEAGIAIDIDVYPAEDLKQAIEILSGSDRCKPLVKQNDFKGAAESVTSRAQARHDMKDIRGNDLAKRGLEIAAAGGHNLLMFGQAGTGKTMLAQSFPGIMPPLTFEEAVEVTGIHSAAKVLSGGIIAYPPFRAPHHTASYPAVIGGGMYPKPGEITLAHRGVLFLDEFPEFDRSVLEALREPLEERSITVARAKGSVTFPADCILLASMNPCPCGKPKNNGCSCLPHIINAYRRRVSGPIMERLDLWINVNKVDYEKLSSQFSSSEDSATIQKRVVAARERQKERFLKHGIQKSCNAQITAGDMPKICLMKGSARAKLTLASKRLGFSGRSVHRIMKISRTIADLKSEEYINDDSMLEALQYRQKIDGEE